MKGVILLLAIVAAVSAYQFDDANNDMSFSKDEVQKIVKSMFDQNTDEELNILNDGEEENDDDDDDDDNEKEDNKSAELLKMDLLDLPENEIKNSDEIELRDDLKDVSLKPKKDPFLKRTFRRLGRKFRRLGRKFRRLGRTFRRIIRKVRFRRFGRFRFRKLRFRKFRRVFRLRRLRFRRLVRFRRILRFRRLFRHFRFRFRLPWGGVGKEACPHSENTILAAINGIKCDIGKWKEIFDDENVAQILTEDEDGVFKGMCQQKRVCLSCKKGQPWDQPQCMNKFKSNFNEFCSALAKNYDEEDQEDAFEWCNHKVDEIVAYEKKKPLPTRQFYCECGKDVTDIGDPNKKDD